MFFGESMFSSNGTSFVKKFKEYGYITGHSNNMCARFLYDIEDSYTENVTFESFDHENVAMMCDPNYHNPSNPFTPYLGPYSVRRRCLYGKDTFRYVLEYGRKFWESYSKSAKLLFLAFQDAHEGTMEVAKYLDEALGEEIQYMENKGELNDTAVFIISDHGNNMIGFYNLFNAEDYVIEKTLGTWIMLLPSEKLNQQEIEYLNENQQKYVTPYDIHSTFLYLLSPEEKGNKLGKSVFGFIEEDRNCDNYKLDLKKEWCRCREK